jgi:hypothetical protein
MSRFHEILCLARGLCKHRRRNPQSIGFYFDAVFARYMADGRSALKLGGDVHQWHGSEASALPISFTPGHPWQAIHRRAGLSMTPTEPAATSPSCASPDWLTQDDIRLKPQVCGGLVRFAG